MFKHNIFNQPLSRVEPYFSLADPRVASEWKREPPIIVLSQKHTIICDKRFYQLLPTSNPQEL